MHSKGTNGCYYLPDAFDVLLFVWSNIRKVQLTYMYCRFSSFANAHILVFHVHIYLHALGQCLILMLIEQHLCHDNSAKGYAFFCVQA